MRNAPSVSYLVGRCAFQGWVLLGLAGLGALALGLLWWLYPALPLAWGAAGAGLLVVWMGWALGSWWHAPKGRLRWDAHATDVSSGGRPAGRWSWQANGDSAAELDRVDWVLDVQSVLLLRLHVASARDRWIWLDAGHDPAAWDHLRRALVAHA